jgi:hypothetical protein
MQGKRKGSAGEEGLPFCSQSDPKHYLPISLLLFLSFSVTAHHASDAKMASTGDAGDAGILAQFEKIGLESKAASETLNNKKLCTNLLQIISEAGVQQGCPKPMGVLLYNIAVKMPDTALDRKDLVKYVATGKVTSLKQLEAAFVYFRKQEKFVAQDFERECGVGVQVTANDIQNAIDKVSDAFSRRLEKSVLAAGSVTP